MVNKETIRMRGGPGDCVHIPRFNPALLGYWPDASERPIAVWDAVKGTYSLDMRWEPESKKWIPCELFLDVIIAYPDTTHPDVPGLEVAWE